MGIHKYSFSYSNEDYIDINLFSSPKLFCYPSPTRDLEFEFKMYPFPLHKTSPADELFFNGKLLPLHLPPPSQNLHNYNYSLPESPTEHSVGKPDQCFFHPLKKLKQSLLRKKLKASTAYLKSLFTKSGDEFSCTKRSAIRHGAVQPEHFEDLSYMKISNKSPFGDIDIVRFKLSNGFKKNNIHKKMAQRRYCLMSSPSSSGSHVGSSNSAFSVSSSKDLQLVKRSMNAKSSEVDNSIEGAIAYCKKSYEQQLRCSTEVEVCSLPVSTLVTCGALI